MTRLLQFLEEVIQCGLLKQGTIRYVWITRRYNIKYTLNVMYKIREIGVAVKHWYGWRSGEPTGNS